MSGKLSNKQMRILGVMWENDIYTRLAKSTKWNKRSFQWNEITNLMWALFVVEFAS